MHAKTLVLGLTLLLSHASLAADPQIKVGLPGQNISVWDGWNVSATIFVNVDGGKGDDCIKLWWIRMGVNSDAWEICNQTRIQISLPLIYGELRAGGFKRQSAVAVSDNAFVAQSIQLCGRVIDC